MVLGYEHFLSCMKNKLGRKGVISFVGASGKSTTIKEFSRDFSREGKSVLWTTSTTIGKPNREDYDQLLIGSAIDMTRPHPGSITVYGDTDCGFKLKTLDMVNIDTIIERDIFDYVFIEADGAKMRYIKAPADYEPVISKYTNITVGLIGANSLGKKIKDMVHREDIYRTVTKAACNDLVTVDQVINLIRSKEGIFKGSLGERVLLMNKVESHHKDDMETIKRAIEDLDIEFHICRLGDIGG